MKIDQLTVINFKNFEHVTVDFNSGVNLFVGGNGSGKTSILEAINVAAGGFFASQRGMARYINFDEIRVADGIRLPEASVAASSDAIPGVSWTRTIKRGTKANDTKGVNPIGIEGRTFFEQYFDDPNDRHIAPLIAYYSTQRLFKDSNISEKQKYDPANGRRNGYLQALRETAIKGVLNEWLGNAVTRRATLHIKEIEDVDLVLENVEAAIRKTLILFLDLSADFSLKIYQDPDFENELFVNFDRKHNFPLTYYSDGFRNLIYLVFDLVWRASQLNPWLDLNGISQQVKGIVTIDEIDLHLHPRWQANAIRILQLLFPEVQFFITTHSPTVVSNFEHGTLYVISNDEIERYEKDFFGKQINSVLRNVLGAAERHIPTQQRLDRLFHLIQQNDREQYRELFNELVEQLGREDIDIQKAKALIEMKELLN